MASFASRVLALSVIGAFTAAPSVSFADYHLERILSGLTQPVGLAQAPGDPANILYYAERITAAPGTGGGFGGGAMGGIYRYDTITKTKTLVLSLSSRNFSGDEGLTSFAFSPDFNTPGAPGFQKIYVASCQAASLPLDRVEEYSLTGPNGTVPLTNPALPASPTNPAAAVATRLILQYSNANSNVNHTIDTIMFDPTAPKYDPADPKANPERNYLYITTGDGSFGASAANRPSQKPNDIKGKLLRIDIDPAHGDAYPGVPEKNFAIPATNPIPLYNSQHPAAQLTGVTINGTVFGNAASELLGEIYATGLRNSYRTTFDRATGDIYFGDVGENTVEEIDFLRHGGYDGTRPPVDFGWGQREGTQASIINGVTTNPSSTTLTWNTSNGGTIPVASVNPIRQFTHAGNQGASISGYVYHGPIPELQGKYFFSDFPTSRTWMLDFNPITDPALFNGANGTLTLVADTTAASLWNSLIIDPSDPNYKASLGNMFGLGHVVSFAEDNAGNLYVIDFGGNRGDQTFGTSGQYPNAGQGEIFKLVPGPIPEPATLLLTALGVPLLLRRKSCR